MFSGERGKKKKETRKPGLVSKLMAVPSRALFTTEGKWLWLKGRGEEGKRREKKDQGICPVNAAAPRVPVVLSWGEAEHSPARSRPAHRESAPRGTGMRPPPSSPPAPLQGCCAAAAARCAPNSPSADEKMNKQINKSWTKLRQRRNVLVALLAPAAPSLQTTPPTPPRRLRGDAGKQVFCGSPFPPSGR